MINCNQFTSPKEGQPKSTRLSQKWSRGYTLVEALVAISIVLVATTAPFVLIQRSLNEAKFAQDQVIASNLAQEGIEMVRAIRDSNRISETGSFVNIDNICQVLLCTVDITANLDSALMSCGLSACPPLKYFEGLYHNSDLGGDPTKFTRSILVDTVVLNSDERVVTVTVFWETRPGDLKTVSVSEHMFDFQ